MIEYYLAELIIPERFNEMTNDEPNEAERKKRIIKRKAIPIYIFLFAPR